MRYRDGLQLPKGIRIDLALKGSHCVAPFNDPNDPPRIHDMWACLQRGFWNPGRLEAICEQKNGSHLFWLDRYLALSWRRFADARI
jgi:hypothetical protein